MNQLQLNWKEMSLFNQNFSNHADSQVEEDRIALEQSHRTCDEYDVSSFFTKSGEWLKSQGLEFLVHVV